MLKPILSFIVVSLSMIQSSSSIVFSPTFDDQIEEYIIYSTIINSFHNLDATKTLLIVDHTYDPAPPEDIFEEYKRQQPPYLAKATLNDYRQKNAKQNQLTERFDIRHKHALLSKDDYDETFKEGCSGWCKFQEKYPESSEYMRFSRVGFNRTGTQALIYVIHGCGGLCGSGGYVLLAKQDGIWRIQKWMNAWVS